MMEVLHKTGMQPPMVRPPVVLHDPRQRFVGDTMKEALLAAGGAFGIPPAEVQIIFCCLPGRKKGDVNELYSEVLPDP